MLTNDAGRATVMLETGSQSIPQLVVEAAMDRTAPVEIVIRFDPSVTQRVHETRWHHSQVEELEDDGSLLWRARVAGVLEIRSWILSWGPDAEVLEPPELEQLYGQGRETAEKQAAGQ